MSAGPARRLPAPRPALRKAPDAEHHPAAGPSGAGDAAAPAPEPASGTERARTPGQTHSAAATAFWDTLQTDAAATLARTSTPDVPEVVARAEPDVVPAVARVKGGKSKAKKKFSGATSDVLRSAKSAEDHDLLLGKQVSLEVRVPKRLRKAATAQAQRHGTTLDSVVTGLLAGWVDGS